MTNPKDNSSLPIFDKFELMDSHQSQIARDTVGKPIGKKSSAITHFYPFGGVVGAKPRKTIKLPDEKVNRKDYTKKCVSRSLSNPCTYDYNMRSTGAPSHVKNQLTFTGGIASFIGEPEQSFRRVTTNPTLSTGRKDSLNKSLDLTSQSKVASKMVDLGRRENITMSARPFNELLNKKVTYSGSNKNEVMQGRRAEQARVTENVTKHVTELLGKGGPITNGLNGVVSNGLGDGQTADIKDLVKDAVKEYFDSMNLPQLASQSYSRSPLQQKPQTLGNPEFRGYNESGEEVWAVVKKDPFAELGLMNTSASRPGSRMMALRQSAPPNSFQRSQNQLWNNDGDFQNSLNSWAMAAPSHEREIVKNLLKRLNGGQTPAEFANRPSRRAASATPVEPYQYQCDLSMFSNPPFNPSRHFTINPEWTSERLEVKKIPAAHLHPSATLKNKLGLLRS